MKELIKPTPDIEKVSGWQESQFWKKNWIPGLIIFISAFALYWNTLPYEYVLDDKIVISENSYTKKGFAGIKEIFTTESFQGYFGEQRDLIVGGRYRPLSIVTFAIEHQFFGLNPTISHFGNILLYALTGLMIFRILSLFLYRPLEGRYIWLVAVPLLTSLFFIFHPIHTEVVANIKGRDEIMSMIGSLGALYFALKYLKKADYINLLSMSLSMFLATMSKENAITWLAIIPMSMWVFTKASKKDYFQIILWLLIPVIGYMLIRYQVIGYFLSAGNEITNIMNNPFYGMSGNEKYATIFYTLLIYIKLLIFPHPLTHDYYPYQIPIMNWGNIWVLFSILLHIALTAFGLYATYKKKISGYAVLFYLITLSIVSNLPFTIGTFMNERFVYVSSLGFSLLVAHLIINHLNKKSYIAGLILSILILAGYTYKTLERTPVWENTLTLNLAAIEVSTNSARANLFAGVALFKEKAPKVQESDQKLEVYKQAQKYFRKATEIHPTYSDALHMRSGVAGEIYKLDRNITNLLNEFYEVLKNRPGDPHILNFMAYLNRTRTTEPELVNFYHKVGHDLFQMERFNSGAALKFLELGLQIAPNNITLLEDMAKLYYAVGNNQKGSEYTLRYQNIKGTTGN